MEEGKFNVGNSILKAQTMGKEEICYDEWGEPWASWNGCDAACVQACIYCGTQGDCDEPCTNCGNPEEEEEEENCVCNRCGAWMSCTTTSHGCSTEGGDNSGTIPGGGGITIGGGGGGGSGTTTGKPKVYTSRPGDKFVKPNIPSTLPKQVGATCLFASMSFINNFLGGNITDGTFLKNYVQKYNLNVISIAINGAYVNHVSEFASLYFETGSFISYKNAIDKGYFVMTDIPTTESYNHCVVIVGYHSNGDLIYMDTVTGNLQECSSSYPAGSFNVPINKINE